MRYLIFCALVLASTGCTGDGLFRRDTVARGQGYGPFSSKAARLDVTPLNAAHPTKKDILFVATVYDADGSTLRRREVEWMIEGPGEFVTVDDGGWFTSRGKKSGGKFATTTTHTFEEKLAKKTYSSSAEEPLIKAGQTWVVVSSAVEGKTTITVNCPDISDRDKGRLTATVLWSDAEYGFPSQAVVPAGGEHQLKTDLARVASTSGTNGYRVRYRIVGGAAATLVPGGAGVTSLTGGNPQDVTTNANADGTAGVKIVQAVPASGRTTVVVEVIKPDPNGVGAGTIVARNETAVEWAAPQLSLDLRGPATVGEGRDVPYTLTVANAGKAESPQVTLRATLPNTVSFVSSDPPQSSQQGRDITWVLPAVATGEKREVRLTVRPVRKGSFELAAVAQTPDGMRAEQKISSTADTAAIRVSVDAPAYAPVGEYVPVRVVVTNTGAVTAGNATAWVTGGDGLTAERRDPGEPAEVPVGTVEPGKSKTGTILMKADRAGKYTVKANVTADGGLTEKAESSLEARTAQIKLDLAGPDRVGVGEPATYTIKLKNAGDMALSAVAVKADLPRGLNATDAEGGRISNAGGVAMWTVPAINPGETKMLKLSAVGEKVGPAATIFATASAGLSGAKGLEVKAETPVTVAGLPAVELELADPAGPIPVGGKATYRITVRNRGTGPARDVQITVEVPGELTAVSGRTNDSRTASIDDGRIIFPAIASLPAGAAVTVFAETEAVRPGSARVRATVTGPDLPQPVREEQATRVSGGGK